MKNYNEAVNTLFEEKGNLVIIGLTGRTGSGCSTASEILKKAYNKLELEYEKRECDNNADEYKFRIIKEFIGAEKRWIPFTCIEGSSVILSYVYEIQSVDGSASGSLINYLTELQGKKNEVTFKIDNFDALIGELKGLNYIFEDVQKHQLPNDGEWVNFDEMTIEKYYSIYINKMSDYKDRIKKILQRYSCYEVKKKKIQDELPIKCHLYTYLLQKIGNNVRASGNPYVEAFAQEKILSFAKRLELMVNLIIKYDQIKGKNKTRICIDAIRNANESNYLKDKYRSYFLMSINVNESTRRNRLNGLDIDEQRSLDNVEYNAELNSEEFFYHQNIANCFEVADIHLVNEDENSKKFFLTWQLVKYVTLIIHPGLITSSAIERCMQLAYNAKYNSGCISRQVGAVITGPDYAVKSIGWNEVPSGHLSCSLRDIRDYCKGNMKECYSKFEHEDESFQRAMNSIKSSIDETDLHGRKFPYCFKDIYNGYKNEKNQVHTRALHAEENAFLQISKYGGQGVKGGFLFCTASPCELCSKKAYQLGIENIYYIDPYPGISEKHILSFGNSSVNPKMNLFYGAIGEAYLRLYKPLLACKDEIKLVSGINCKNEVDKLKKEKQKEPKTKDFYYHKIEVSIEFKNRENIESIREIDMEVLNGAYTELSRKLTWTGSSYDKSELEDNTEGYELIDSKDKISPYCYKILLNKEVKEKDRIKYKIKSDVKDETKLMHPYFAQMIKHPTKQLVLNVIFSKTQAPLENIKYVRYADLKMECQYDDEKEILKTKEDGDKVIYTLDINNPNLFYTYSLEWDFIKIKS